MFRRKKEDAATGDDNAEAVQMSAPPMKPFTRKGSHVPSKPPPAPTYQPEPPRRQSPDIPAMHTRQSERIRNGGQDSKRLMIGRDICLNGEITACTRLIVEGRAEVTLQSAHTLEVTDSGFFKGVAEVDVADISGEFEGELIAKGQLIVRAGGRINGTVRYGRIVIEAGGQVSGDMQALATDDTETPAENP